MNIQCAGAGATGVEGLAAVPVGGGGAWPGFECKTEAHVRNPAPLVWRAPEGPEGTGGLRGAAPNVVRLPSLAGGRALRRPEHPWGTQSSPTQQGMQSSPAQQAVGPDSAWSTSGLRRNGVPTAALRGPS